MKTRLKVTSLALLVCLTGCATATKSSLLGAALGGAAGAGIGQATEGNSTSTLTGLAIGAGFGALVGFLSHKDESPANPGNAQEDESDVIPEITQPKVRSIVVPDTIEGNKFIKSHRVFILEDSGNWAK